jgi:hypothetical protein
MKSRFCSPSPTPAWCDLNRRTGLPAMASSKRLAMRLIISPLSDEPWMQQIARNVTMEGCGALRDCRYLLHDRDTKYTHSFRAIIASGQVEAPRSEASTGCLRMGHRFSLIFSEEIPAKDTFPAHSLNDNRTIYRGAGMTQIYIAFLLLLLLVSVLLEGIDGLMLLLRSARRRRDRRHTARPRHSLNPT